LADKYSYSVYDSTIQPNTGLFSSSPCFCSISLTLTTTTTCSCY